VRSVLYGKVVSEESKEAYAFWQAGKEPLENTQKLSVSYYVLCYTLNRLLRLLHPFIPFITEEIYQSWPIKDKDSIMLETYPKGEDCFSLSKASKENQVEFVRDVVVAIRTLRGENNIKPSAPVDVEIYVENSKDLEKIKQTIGNSISNVFFMERLNSLRLVDKIDDKPSAVMKMEDFSIEHLQLSSDVKIIIPLKGLVDIENEKKRLVKQITKYEENLNKLQAQMAGFNEKAPSKIRKDKQNQMKSLESSLKSLRSSLERLNR